MLQFHAGILIWKSGIQFLLETASSGTLRNCGFCRPCWLHFSALEVALWCSAACVCACVYACVLAGPQVAGLLSVTVIEPDSRVFFNELIGAQPTTCSPLQLVLHPFLLPLPLMYTSLYLLWLNFFPSHLYSLSSWFSPLPF